jgi:hypothetical protein
MQLLQLTIACCPTYSAAGSQLVVESCWRGVVTCLYIDSALPHMRHRTVVLLRVWILVKGCVPGMAFVAGSLQDVKEGWGCLVSVGPCTSALLLHARHRGTDLLIDGETCATPPELACMCQSFSP